MMLLRSLELSQEACNKITMTRYVTIGYLIYKNSTAICIAAEHNLENEGYRDVSLIPTQSVISVKKLIVVGQRKMSEVKDTKSNEEADKEWAHKHGIVGVTLYHHGFRGDKLRELWKASKEDFNKYLQMLRQV